MGSRQQLLLLLRKRPGMTVAELAEELAMTGMGVRRHLGTLSTDGLVERAPCSRSGPGRPPSGWRLTAAGMEVFPRRYDSLALELLDDLAPEVLDAAFDSRTAAQVSQYQAALAGCADVEERVTGLARLRDQAGYLAECSATEDGALILTENNCAVHRVAERHPVVCAMELAVMREVLGPKVEVTRVAHAMAGDAVCAYCIRPRSRQAPAE